MFRKVLFSMMLFMFAAGTLHKANAEPDAPLSCNKIPISVVDRDYDHDSGVPKWNMNRDLVAANFGFFAAASADAYSIENKRLFLTEKALSKIGWSPLNWQAKGTSNRFTGWLSGLAFDTYYRKLPGCIVVVVAIRGTEGLSLRDWNSNTAWFTGFLPIDNQYRNIDRVFPQLKKFLAKEFPNREIRIVATGHSLGGGLSQHLAYCFNEISAVTFNTSVVSSSFFCRKRQPLIIEIYDKDEVLTRLRNFFGSAPIDNVNTDLYATYNMNPIEMNNKHIVKQHSIDGMAASLLRMAIVCQNNRPCEISKKFVQLTKNYSYVLYCEAYRPQIQPRLAKDSVCGKVN